MQRLGQSHVGLGANRCDVDREYNFALNDLVVGVVVKTNQHKDLCSIWRVYVSWVVRPYFELHLIDLEFNPIGVERRRRKLVDY